MHRFGLFGQIHQTHAAFAELIEDLIRADRLADH
jgi:hypothetical protein